MSILPLLAICVSSVPTVTAQPICERLLHDTWGHSPAMPNDELATVVGTHSGLTRRTFAALTEAQARTDIRAALEAGGLEMDVWWGSIGSAIIADNVRNAEGLR
ncbi:MAG: hypothetical protein EON58_17215 [Alphaproteobacteria bacterium]|nr:MAG: hypothetical protein EON58_17215 [Alphaproteobacteria bacterium]